MCINENKSKIVHFRPRTVCDFRCGDKNIAIVDRYVYLGLLLDELLNYNVTAKFVSQAASRALGLLIAKYKSLGGMPHHVYKKLYDSMVWPVISYAVAVRCTQRFSCIEAIENRAMRFFMGTGKYTLTLLLPVIWAGSLFMLNS